MGNKPSSEAFLQRGKELKTEVDECISNFLKAHCEKNPAYFVPITMLQTAWVRYCVANKCLSKIQEYYNDRHNERHGRIFWGDDIIPRDNMYIGIRLNSWPECPSDIRIEDLYKL